MSCSSAGTGSNADVRWRQARMVLLASLALGSGCVTAPSKVPTAEEEATRAEKTRCSPDVDESSIAWVFAHDAVVAVDPLYTTAAVGGQGAGGNYSQLIGAIVRLRAMRGVTAEWLDRALECHSARRVLGRMPETTNPTDPFWLPGRTIDIEAVAARGEYRVHLRGANIRDAEAILARANAFLEASSHP